MSINLIAVRNPQWKTLKQSQLDADGNEVLDSDGNNILENVTDADGNPKKVIDVHSLDYEAYLKSNFNKKAKLNSDNSAVFLDQILSHQVFLMVLHYFHLVLHMQ